MRELRYIQGVERLSEHGGTRSTWHDVLVKPYLHRVLEQPCAEGLAVRHDTGAQVAIHAVFLRNFERNRGAVLHGVTLVTRA